HHERRRLDRKLLATERAADDRQSFFETRVALLERRSEAGELVLEKSRPDAHRHPPAGQMRQPRDLLRKPQRLMQRHDGDRVTDTHTRRSRGDRGREYRRRGDEAEPGEVMLREPDALESVLFGDV